jgi:radical SAM-linked protein
MVAMVAEPSQTANASIPKVGTLPPSQPAPRYKYRLRFRKGGDLRLVSHHDLMNVFERMLRRAALPVAQTQGFHPQPRLVFALSLALGVAGAKEVVDLELTEPLDADNIHKRLASQAPAGLDILSLRSLEGKSSSLVRRAFYSLPLALPVQGEPPIPDNDPLELFNRCQNLLAQTHLWIERSRPQPRKLDIRPYLSELTVHDNRLELAVWVTPTGTARPEEFARLLGLEHLLQAGAFFERTDLEMMDETSAPMSLAQNGDRTPEIQESCPRFEQGSTPEIIIAPAETTPQERIT